MDDKQFEIIMENIDLLNTKMNFIMGSLIDKKFNPVAESMSDEEIENAILELDEETAEIEEEVEILIEEDTSNLKEELFGGKEND